MAPQTRGSLRRLVQSLPPELYKEIYELTFTAAPNKIVKVDLTYKPPIELQVNQASRELFLESYHENTTFYIDEGLWKKWSKSLHTFPEVCFKDIRLIGPEINAAHRTRSNLEQALKLKCRYCDDCDRESDTDDFRVSMKVTFGNPEEYMWLRCDEPLVLLFEDYTKSAYSWYLEERARGFLKGGPPVQPDDDAGNADDRRNTTQE